MGILVFLIIPSGFHLFLPFDEIILVVIVKEMHNMISRTDVTSFLTGLLILGIISRGCAPNRPPGDPEDLETRRPKVAYILPPLGSSVLGEEDTLSTDVMLVAGDSLLDASKYDTLQAWFDELMDESSIEKAFSLYISVTEEPWAMLSSVSALDLSISNPDMLVVGRRERGALMSLDSGESWQFLRSLAGYRVTLLRIDPEDDSTIYAVANSLLLKSSDKGSQWNQIHVGLPGDVLITSIDFDPSNSNSIWIGTNYGVFVSHDKGTGWESTGELPNWRSDRTIVKIAVDFQNSMTVYAATLGRYIFKSTNGGSTWEMKRNGLPGSRIFDVVIDPNESNVLYAATDIRGIYKSTNAGEDWFASTEGLDTPTSRIIRFNPDNSMYLFVATVSELYSSFNAGTTWQVLSVPSPGDTINEFFIHPLSSDGMFLTSFNNIYGSDNGSLTWTEKELVDQESILTGGMLTYTVWQDTLCFVNGDNDTVATIFPYRPSAVLDTYDAGIRTDPPIDPDPKATKLLFVPDEALLSNWMYRVVVRGVFEEGTWRQETGAHDVHDMSLEYDEVFYFIAGKSNSFCRFITTYY